MKRILTCGALWVALAIPLGVGVAGAAENVSAFALPVEDTWPLVGVGVSPVGVQDKDDHGFARRPSDGYYESSRYRPRRARHRDADGYSRRSQTVTQVHAGFFDPDGDQNSEFVFGLRGALLVDPHVQLGAGLDWHHKSDRSTEVISTGPGPGGQDIVTRRALARSSSNLFPLMAFVQFNADPNLPIVPYVGVAGGYQILHLSAEDFQTGEEFEGTFDGLGWQAWIGAGFPLSGRARLNAEVFVNDAELGRDIEDALTGEQFRETVDVQGAGMRFGVSWGF
ncbi:MAG TPA: outer membrane beta-barrel protein [Candidatus Limnocylindria bacterium]|nr:outer membrane beta-barrel protein [Candidatus Limnocylindria bacterium]